MSKKYKDSIADDAQESLVDALENIKNLLEKSENKLSAARESIALANSSSSKAKALTTDEEEDIPVLSEEVIPTLEEVIQPDLMLDVPLPIAAEKTSQAETMPEEAEPVTPLIQGIASEDVMALIDEFQQRLQPVLNKTITNCSLANLEEELLEALKQETDQLRNEITQLDS
jgi:hypothetical protein